MKANKQGKTNRAPHQKSKVENRKFRASLTEWFKKNARDLPWRRRRDPYAVLVSEIMLQQTQVATVVDYFERWMRRFPDFSTLAHASEAEVLHAWQGLGYYSRARNLHRAAKAVIEKHGGNFPRALEAIRELPGVGRYTAGAVATFAFDAATPVVDGNIARVLARLFDFREPVDAASGREKIWGFAARVVPEKNAGIFNEALMELGALVCTPKPKCGACPVSKFCRARDPENLPIKKPRRKTIPLVERHAFILSRGKILLQRADHRWRGLWIFPPIDNRQPAIDHAPPLARVIFPFTHHRITLEVFQTRAPKKIRANQAWCDFFSLEKIAMPSPHRRALQQLAGHFPAQKTKPRLAPRKPGF